jgi:hypothetical protein
MQSPLRFQVASRLLDADQDDEAENVSPIKHRLVCWGERDARTPMSKSK